MYSWEVRKLLFVLVLILIFWALFSQPLKEMAATYDAGFTIEKLTYLPESYADVAEEKYFALGKYIPGNNLVDTEFRSGENYFRFIQAADNYAVESYIDALDAGTFYKRENVLINDTSVTVTYYNDERRRFMWLAGSKRYDVITNDLGLNWTDIEKIQSGLVLAKIDFWETPKKAWGSFISTLDPFSAKTVEP